MLREGKGVDRDPIEAWLWASSAYDLMSENPAARGEIRAILERLESEMGAEQVAATRAQVRDWKPESSAAVFRGRP